MRVVDGEGVHDAGAGKRRDGLGEPREAFGLGREMQHIERQALAIERAAQHDQITAELIDNIGDHPIVRRCRSAKHRHAPGEQVENAREPSVIGAEVVAPVADAVRLVDHEESGARGELGQHHVAELFVRESFGRHEKEIDPVGIDIGDDLLPIAGVVARDAGRVHAAAFARVDLIAHEAEEGRDQQRRARVPRAQEPGRDEVDRALAPAGALHDEDTVTTCDQRLDGLELRGSELSVRSDEGARRSVRLFLELTHCASLAPGWDISASGRSKVG